MDFSDEENEISKNVDQENQTPEDEIKRSTTFDEMNLKEDILKGIYSYGLEKPAPCQQIIPSILEGLRDAIISAPAGSGKTIIFCIAALQNVVEEIKNTQIVILSPTRELALQTYGVICSLANYTKISIALHRGVGNNKKREETNQRYKNMGVVKSEGYMSFGNATDGKEQIIVVTPGRLLDIMTRDNIKLTETIRIKQLNMSFISMLILDEADELLSPLNHFQETLTEIFDKIPTINYCQKIIISATITTPILEICDKILANPLKILIKKQDIVLAGIKQYYVSLPSEEDKIECILDIYSQVSISTSIIFTNEKKKAEYIYNKMKEEKFSVGYIHATMEQVERDKIMKNFRNGTIRVLIATDLLARGIDVQTVSTVFNYDLPNEKENYIHRIGRSGRYGRKGMAINLVLDNTKTKPRIIKDLENYYSLHIDYLPNLNTLTGL